MEKQGIRLILYGFFKNCDNSLRQIARIRRCSHLVKYHIQARLSRRESKHSPTEILTILAI